jgi:hypothetical protein
MRRQWRAGGGSWLISGIEPGEGWTRDQTGATISRNLALVAALLPRTLATRMREAIPSVIGRASRILW